MKATTLLLLLTGAAALPSSHEQTTLRSSHGQTTYRIPTSYESAILARRILALTPLGTLSTIFPSDSKNNPITPKENRPDGLGGMPHGLLEYISDCEPNSTGNPTILALNIETTFKNVAAGSNISLAVTWTPPHPPARAHAHQRKSHHHKKFSWLSWFGFGSSPSHDHHHHTEEKEEDTKPEPKSLPYSPAALPRFSLLGYIEPIPDGDDRSAEIGKELAECFTKYHPDAKWWLPGNRIHESHFVRLVVEQVYWIGGFGDRAYIGWIPVEEWRKVTKEEWESVRLPGEKKGWREYSSQGDL